MKRFVREIGLLVVTVGTILFLLETKSKEFFGKQQNLTVQQLLMWEPVHAEEGSDEAVDGVSEVREVEKKHSVSSVETLDGPTNFTEEDVVRIHTLQSMYNKIKREEMLNPKFEVAPIITPTEYSIGTFNEKTLQNAAEYLNYQRKIAYLPEITLSEGKTNYAQKAAISLAALDRLSHHIGSEYTKPEGMTEDFWNEGSSGAYYSSLTQYNKDRTFPQLIESFMYDYGDYNQAVGHRAVLINPKNESVGFGYAQSPKSLNFYGAIYSQGETSYRTENNFVTSWPSKGVFPINQMYSDLRWSTHFVDRGYQFSDAISVKLTETTTGKEWNFSKQHSDGEFTIVPYAYGYRTIVFRPNNITYDRNQEYEVLVKGITGTENGEYKYTTKMFDITQEYNLPITSITFDKENEYLKKGESKKLDIQITPDIDTYKEKLVWTSSDPKILDIQSDGTVTGKNYGKSTVTATSEDGKVSAKITITVEDDHGDDLEQATELEVEKPVKYKVDYQYDYDFVTFTAPEKGDYVLRIKSLSTVEKRHSLNYYGGLGKGTWYDAANQEEWTSYALEKGQKIYGAISSQLKDAEGELLISKLDHRVELTALESLQQTIRLNEERYLQFDKKVPKQLPSAALSYYSSNSKVVTVDNEGKIKAVGKGTARIEVNPVLFYNTGRLTFVITVEDDHGNDLEQATELEVEKPVKYKVDYQYDYDFVTFTAPEKGDYVLRIKSLSTVEKRHSLNYYGGLGKGTWYDAANQEEWTSYALEKGQKIYGAISSQLKDAEGELSISKLDHRVELTALESLQQTIRLNEERYLQFDKKVPKQLPSAALSYYSSNSKVVTVDNEGKIKAVGKGTARIEVNPVLFYNTGRLTFVITVEDDRGDNVN